MRLILISILTVVNVSCGAPGKEEAKPTINTLDDILEVRDAYLDLIPEVQDDFGFIYSDKCDSLLHSGLASYGGADVDILAARDEDSGQWYRTPYKDCYSNERRDIASSRRSKSTISRDMLAGAMWSLQGSGDLASLERLIDYGKGHKWIMGQGPLDRTFFTHNFQDTLYRLAGRDWKGPPYLWVDPIKDHQRHVVALNIILRGEKQCEIDAAMLDLLAKFRNSSPQNALFQYGYHRFTDGDQEQTLEILSRFPSDRLPTNEDWCGRWLWEKDEDHDSWRACDETREHSGGDLLFIAKLLEDSESC